MVRKIGRVLNYTHTHTHTHIGATSSWRFICSCHSPWLQHVHFLIPPITSTQRENTSNHGQPSSKDDRCHCCIGVCVAIIVGEKTSAYFTARCWKGTNSACRRLCVSACVYKYMLWMRNGPPGFAVNPYGWHSPLVWSSCCSPTIPHPMPHQDRFVGV